MVSRLYDGRPRRRMPASWKVSYSMLVRGMPLALRKSVSNWMKWPTIGASPMNSASSSRTSSKEGALATSASLMPVIWDAMSGIGIPGLTRVS